MISKSICSIVDVERYIEKAGAEDLKAIRDLGYNIFMDSWLEETFDEIRFGIQVDNPMDICIDFSHN